MQMITLAVIARTEAALMECVGWVYWGMLERRGLLSNVAYVGMLLSFR